MLKVVYINVISIHAPTRGATITCTKARTITAISIHAPTRGATIITRTCQCPVSISIHAPTRGATKQYTSRFRIRKFQSTLPQGERHCSFIFSTSFSAFQSTLPQGERLLKDTRQIQLDCYFNPRSHKGSDFSYSLPDPVTDLFQSTLPQGERQITQPHLRRGGAFQSTLPQGERQETVSICFHQSGNFNPRSHKGSDQILRCP